MDDTKAAENYTRHGVSFDLAKKVFSDPFAVERIDDRQDYGEEPYIIIGLADGELLFVAYTEREERIRFISAWHQKRLRQRPALIPTRSH